MRGIGNMNTQGTKSDFSTKFDRLYATQKYIAAFDLCIQNVKTLSMDEVQKKAELVIPKLKGNLELSNVDKFTYDDIVDIFIGTKYKMMMKKGKLIISFSLVEICKENKKVYITCHSRISIFLAILLSFITPILMEGLGFILYEAVYYILDWPKGCSSIISLGLPIILGGIVIKKVWTFQYNNWIILRKIAIGLLNKHTEQ